MAEGTRSEIVERLAMALVGLHYRSIDDWKDIPRFLRGTYRKDAALILAHTSKAGLTITLKLKPARKLTPATTLCGPVPKKKASKRNG